MQTVNSVIGMRCHELDGFGGKGGYRQYASPRLYVSRRGRGKADCLVALETVPYAYCVAVPGP